MKNQNQIPLSVIGMGALTGVTVVAPMFGMAGIVVALVTSCILITVAFHLAFQGMNQPRVHNHYHYQAEASQRPYTEGHERAALLPNGTQIRERIVKRYDQ